MQYIQLIALVILILLHIAVILLLRSTLRRQQPKELKKLLQMQKEEHRLRQEQNAGLNESLRTSMQLVSENLAQNQTQTRETTAAQLRQFEARIQGLEQSNAQAMQQLQETLRRETEQLRAQNFAQLQEIRQTVDTTLQTHIDAKMTESFRRVTQSLEAVYRGLGEMRSLAEDVGGLKRVLSNVKTRGTLGEIQLSNILQEILAPEQYAVNAETVPGSGKRVEFAVKLPTESGTPVYLPIDSKFPADCYMQLLDAQESGDKAAVTAAQNHLRQRVLSFAKDIHEKYIREPDTTAFGIMFLPFEGLYSEVVSSGISEEMQRKYAVTAAGPSTMAALLNALSMGFKTLAIQKQSDQVWEILSGVKSEFANFEDALNRTRSKLDSVGKELDSLVGTRTRAINRQLAKVQEYGKTD